ncbi:MAG: 6-bladed beta-propeller [Bacteroidota bacterium]
MNLREVVNIYVLSILLLGIIGGNSLFAQAKADDQNVVFNEVYNVSDFKVVNDSLMVIYDRGRKGQEISLININTHKVVGSTRIGKGPGEISDKMVRLFVDRENQSIYVSDFGQLSISTFDYHFNLVDEQVLDIDGPPMLMAVPLASHKKLIFDMGSESFARLYDTEQSEELLRYPFVQADNDYLLPIQANPLMKQGVMCLGSSNRNVIYASEYSSVIINITEQGFSYIHLGKPNLPYPQYEVEQGTLAIPRTDEFTFSTMDLSVDGGAVYVLHSGKKAGTMKSMWAVVSGNIDQLMSDLKSSNQILVYDEATGSYHEMLKLPFETKKAKIYRDRAYLLHENEQGEQTIVSLKIESLQS